MDVRPPYLVYPLHIYPFPGFAEPFSCLTHLFGAIVFCFLAVSLIHRVKRRRDRAVALLIYSVSIVVLLLFSALYHLFSRGELVRDVFQRLDHATIFVLIAATMTPIHVVLFEGVRKWGVMLAVWLLALVGIVLSIGFLHSIPEPVDLCFYLGLGWFGTVSGVALYRRFGFRFIRPLLWGSIAYTAGAILDFLREPVLVPGVIGPHEIFHLAVLAGITWHWRFVQSFIDGVEID